MDRCDSRTVAWSAAKPGAAAGTPTTAPGLLFAPSGLPAAPGHSCDKLRNAPKSVARVERGGTRELSSKEHVWCCWRPRQNPVRAAQRWLSLKEEVVLRTMVFVLAVLCSALAHAGPREDALAQYEKFFEYFRTDNHDQLVTVFSPDVLFTGTISPSLVTDPAGVREYFVKALSGSRGEVKANLFGTTATQISEDVVLVTATWQSERTLDGKMTTNGPSLNSSVMQKRGGRWYIVMFHNSWKPK
jgi:hypothetical protein